MENFKEHIDLFRTVKKSRNTIKKSLRVLKRIEKKLSTKIQTGLKRKRDAIQEKLEFYLKLEEKVSSSMNKIREELDKGTDSDERMTAYRCIYERLDQKFPFVKNAREMFENYYNLIQQLEFHLAAHINYSDDDNDDDDELGL